MVNPKKKDNGHIETVADLAAGTGGMLIEYIKQLNDKYSDINWTINKNNIYGNDINKNTCSLLKHNLYYSLGEECGPIEMLDSLKTQLYN